MLKSSSWKQKLDANSIVQEQGYVMNVEIGRMEVIQKCIWCGYVCFTFYCEKITKKQICYIKHKIKFKFSIYPKWFFFTFFERKMCILYTKIIDLGFWKKVQV